MTDSGGKYNEDENLKIRLGNHAYSKESELLRGKKWKDMAQILQDFIIQRHNQAIRLPQVYVNHQVKKRSKHPSL